MERSRYSHERNTWNFTLCDPIGDLDVCVKGTLCPFYLAGRNKADVEGRPMDFFDMMCCPSEFQTRQQIRSKFNLGYRPWYDCCVTLCFWQCMICQDQRELKVRTASANAQHRPSTMDFE
eukprot:Hpha_TRINITY_DN16850_c1_g7::TRINITY_DN16850_c1_g7_i1::g.152993::m.152993